MENDFNKLYLKYFNLQTFILARFWIQLVVKYLFLDWYYFYLGKGSEFFQSARAENVLTQLRKQMNVLLLLVFVAKLTEKWQETNVLYFHFLNAVKSSSNHKATEWHLPQSKCLKPHGVAKVSCNY